MCVCQFPPQPAHCWCTSLLRQSGRPHVPDGVGRQVTWLTLGRETFCIKPLFKRLSLSTMTNKQYSFPFDFFVRHDFLDVLLCDYSHSSPVFNHSLASYPSEFCVQPSLPHPYPQAERIHLALQLHLSPLE